MKDTFTSMSLKIMAAVLSISSFIGLTIWGMSFADTYGFDAVLGFGFLIGILFTSVLTFCLLYGFAEHLKCITYIAEKIEKFDTCLDAYIDTLREKTSADKQDELKDYGDLNNMSL